jgi:hypothetical protein
MKPKILLSGLFLGLAFISCTTEKKMSEQSAIKGAAHDYLTIDEAISALKVHEAATPLAANPGVSPKLPASFSPHIGLLSQLNSLIIYILSAQPLLALLSWIQVMDWLCLIPAMVMQTLQ